MQTGSRKRKISASERNIPILEPSNRDQYGEFDLHAGESLGSRGSRSLKHTLQHTFKGILGLGAPSKLVFQYMRSYDFESLIYVDAANYLRGGEGREQSNLLAVKSGWIFVSGYVDGAPLGKGGSPYSKYLRCSWKPKMYFPLQPRDYLVPQIASDVSDVIVYCAVEEKKLHIVDMKSQERRGELPLVPDADAYRHVPHGPNGETSYVVFIDRRNLQACTMEYDGSTDVSQVPLPLGLSQVNAFHPDRSSDDSSDGSSGQLVMCIAARRGVCRLYDFHTDELRGELTGNACGKMHNVHCPTTIPLAVSGSVSGSGVSPCSDMWIFKKQGVSYWKDVIHDEEGVMPDFLSVSKLVLGANGAVAHIRGSSVVFYQSAFC
jgi:hypothetical protein